MKELCGCEHDQKAERLVYSRGLLDTPNAWPSRYNNSSFIQTRYYHFFGFLVLALFFVRSSGFSALSTLNIMNVCIIVISFILSSFCLCFIMWLHIVRTDILTYFSFFQCCLPTQKSLRFIVFFLLSRFRCYKMCSRSSHTHTRAYLIHVYNSIDRGKYCANLVGAERHWAGEREAEKSEKSTDR